MSHHIIQPLAVGIDLQAKLTSYPACSGWTCTDGKRLGLHPGVSRAACIYGAEGAVSHRIGRKGSNLDALRGKLLVLERQASNLGGTYWLQAAPHLTTPSHTGPANVYCAMDILCDELGN